MQDFVELVRALKGEETQIAFAARIGLDQSELSRLLSGRLRPTRRAIVGVLRAFPERRDEIIAALTQDSASSAVA